LLCGNGFCLIAILGFPLSVLSGQGLATVAQVQLPLVAISLLANLLGIVCFFVFTVSVFRPTALWAHTLAGAAIACTAMACVAILGALAVAPGSASSFTVTWGWSATFQAACVLCFGWMGIEAFAEWRGRAAGSRSGFGCGDPNRLLMWGVFGLSPRCCARFSCWCSCRERRDSPLAQLSQALFGVLSSGAVTLASSRRVPTWPERGWSVRPMRRYILCILAIDCNRV
jgi:hypothetical protein